MKISVIMSAYKEDEKWLRASIESILNQSFQDFEFIIVLDNPDAKKLDYIIKEYKERFSKIKYFKNKKNMGLVYSLNFALKHAKGEYIARMDADDIEIPTRLEEE